MDPKLVNRLTNDFGTDPDQLPLLQHALARLWSRCSASAAPPVLTVKDYEAIGGLAAALSNHGDEVLAELASERQRIAEIMFRRLSGSEDGRHDVRAPARVEEVAKIAAAEVSEVIAVAEAFRRPDRGFRAVPEEPLRADTMLDVLAVRARALTGLQSHAQGAPDPHAANAIQTDFSESGSPFASRRESG